ncbi:MAG: transporter substrate-binding domain-containing protein [Propionibacteriaceae bacterium]|jgi:polar amino acid transport system substrate-binding protein|nr:transporter substrate-binding domain-containing protein [Propionibacteriaceae bacterium]
MRRGLIGAAALLLAAGALTTLTACGSTDQAVSGGGDHFIVGFDQNFPPYGYVNDDGDFAGFDLDLAAEVAKRNDWQIQYKPINWDNKDQELNSGSIDCIWNGFTIEGREDGYTWTEPYMDNSQVIVVRQDSGINDLAGLKGKTVMAQVDSAALHLLEDGGDQAELGASFKALQQVPDYQSAFLELEQGSVDAVALDLPVAKFQVSGKTDTFTILEDDPLSTEHYGVGFKLGNTDLRDKVQTSLKAMVADDAVEQIAAKYADQGIDFQSWILPA